MNRPHGHAKQVGLGGGSDLDGPELQFFLPAEHLKPCDPLRFSRSETYKSVRAVEIDAGILARVEFELRKFARTVRWRTLKPGDVGEEDSAN